MITEKLEKTLNDEAKLVGYEVKIAHSDKPKRKWYSVGKTHSGQWHQVTGFSDASGVRGFLSGVSAPSSAAAALGSIKSDKKAASSRENGKKGGRPKEYSAEKMGWKIIVRKTAKGWIVDNQSHLGWERYFLSDEFCSAIQNPPTETHIRLLGSWAQDSGKNLHHNRGEKVTITKDAYGNNISVKI